MWFTDSPVRTPFSSSLNRAALLQQEHVETLRPRQSVVERAFHDAMQAANDILQVYRKPEPVQGTVLCTIYPIQTVTGRKVPILFKAIGNAPIMKQNLYKINAQNQFRAVVRFLRKQLGYKPQDPLVCPVVISRSLHLDQLCSEAHIYQLIFCTCTR